MSIRAYLIIDVVDAVDEQQFVRILRELEEMHGVELADPVNGGHDIVALVETTLNIEALIAKIRAKGWAISIEVLPITSIFEKRNKLNRSFL